MPTDAWSTFLRALETPIRHDEDEREVGDELLDAVILLEGDERADAEDLLLDLLEVGLPLAAQALVRMQSTRALPALEVCCQVMTGRFRIAAADALVQLGGDEALAIDALADLARRAPWHIANDAVIALSHFRGDAVEDALIDAVRRPETVVRIHAAEALLEVVGRDDEALRAWLYSAPPEAREHGIAAVRGGELPDMRVTSPTPAFSALLEALHWWDETLPDLDGLAPNEAAFATWLLLNLHDRWGDHRMHPALLHLSPALAETVDPLDP